MLVTQSDHRKGKPTQEPHTRASDTSASNPQAAKPHTISGGSALPYHGDKGAILLSLGRQSHQMLVLISLCSAPQAPTLAVR